MNKQQLENILLLNKVPKDLYSLNGGLPNEAYCIEEKDGEWQVYYSERGIRTNIEYFKNEEKACDCLLNEVKKAIGSI